VAGIKTYIEEAVHELTTKVSWPTWDELQKSSIIVLITCLLLSILIWLMDTVFGVVPTGEGYDGIFGFWKGILGFFYNIAQPGN
jgi:preprotein translocase subunit SecE